MDSFFVLLFLVSIPAFIISLVLPKVLLPIFRGKLQKKGMRWVFGLLIPVSFILIGITSDQKSVPGNSPPVSVQSANQSAPEEETKIPENVETIAPESVPVVETKEEKVDEDIPFQKTTKNDPTLEEGKTEVIQKGVDGVKEFVYTVTYTGGKETDRKLSSENITQEPIEEISAIGTKSPQPVYTAPASCGADYYLNVDGNCVHRPSDNPSGASAKCRDGSYSYSQHRQGTCSGHGGVAAWY